MWQGHRGVWGSQAPLENRAAMDCLALQDLWDHEGHQERALSSRARRGTGASLVLMGGRGFLAPPGTLGLLVSRATRAFLASEGILDHGEQRGILAQRGKKASRESPE